ncbi:MAG: Rieske (2Fe-2S) protein [Deltaproteobacteria bacterium]|nr:Rieske (2Fe-2S) protein [Deltaproteobacteria bacterium]
MAHLDVTDLTPPQPRRQFLCTFGALAGTAALAPLAGCEVSDLHTPKPAAGLTLNFDVASNDFKALAVVGGKAKVALGGQDILLVRASKTEVFAMTNACAHQACPLDSVGNWSEKDGVLTCGCHSAKFSKDGKIVAQPINGGTIAKPPQTFKVTFDGTKGTVTT